MRSSVRFIRRGRLVELADVPPDMLLLDYLRETEGMTGTKEGCREGDCGACTVAVGRLRDGAVRYEPVNACIALVGQMDATEILTVEDLQDGRVLHPIQRAMVENHAAQCGFCTPGFVMSLFTLYHATSGPVTRAQVNDWVAGNLCRCTGYRPIADAAMEACSMPRQDRFHGVLDDMAGVLAYLSDDEDLNIGTDERFFAAPASLESLASLYERHPDAVLVAGATDVGLWITKKQQDIAKFIHVGRVSGFDRVEDDGHSLKIGAGATYAQVEPHMQAMDPDLGELLRRIGSKQVRSSGTMGGNVANGSPIGDTPPALIALGATLELRRGRQVRSMPIEEFYIEYGKQQREPGELLTRIIIPKLSDQHVFRCFKITKRFDQDISSVMGAFRFTVDEQHIIREARCAYGGMAGTPKRAAAAEAALTGKVLRDARAWATAFAALREDFQPMSDHRASARYRIETAHALLGKALIEAAGTTSERTRVIGRRAETGAGATGHASA